MFLLSIVEFASIIPTSFVPMAEIDAGKNDFIGLERPFTKLEVWDDGSLEGVIVSSFASMDKGIPYSVNHDSYVQSKHLGNDGLQKRTTN